jgi:hypothetical protein
VFVRTVSPWCIWVETLPSTAAFSSFPISACSYKS